MRGRAGLVLVGLVAGASAQASPVDRFALVVGLNETSDGSRSALRFADDDAARFYELLAPVSKQAHLLTVLDSTSQRAFPELVPVARAPRRRALDGAVAELKAAIAESHAQGREAELYVYWAGHGDIEDGVGFVHLVDGRFTRPEFRAQILTGLAADVTHVVIDACKSYYLVAGRGPGGRREPQPTAFAGPEPIPGVGYVLSTSSDAEAHEWAALNAGVFSHEVRSGLLGAADADRDGKVDYHELGAFVAAANEGIPVPAFRPAVYVRPPVGRDARPLFAPEGLASTTRLVVDEALGGRLRIVDGRGLRYLDANKTPGATLEVRLLQPQQYEVEFAGTRRTVPAGAGQVRLASLEPSPIVVAQRGQIHRAFEHLFSVPFDHQMVRGFRLAADTYRRTALTGPAPAPEVSPWQPTLLYGGLALVAAGVATTVGAALTQSSIAEAGQTEREGLARRANALWAASVGLYGLGTAATAAGLFAF